MRSTSYSFDAARTVPILFRYFHPAKEWKRSLVRSPERWDLESGTRSLRHNKGCRRSPCRCKLHESAAQELERISGGSSTALLGSKVRCHQVRYQKWSDLFVPTHESYS